MTLEEQLGQSWFNVLKEEFDKEYFQRLRLIAANEYKFHTIYPAKENIFRAYRETPYEQVKVVILGQDCYHSPNHAHGLAFSHPNTDPCLKIAPSLRNIFKELEDDLGKEGFDPQHNEDLTRWARQGIFLLNRTLTVRQGQPNSHKNIGWLPFTWKTVEHIVNKEEPVLFVLWGNDAKTVKPLIKEPHQFIESSHPSPLSCKGFFGTRPFSKINRFLEANYKEKIKWVSS